MAFNKSIVFVLALSSLLSIINNVEATSRSPVDPISQAPTTYTLEDFCHRTEFPGACTAKASPFMSGPVNAFTILQAGLKSLSEETAKATAFVEQTKKETKETEKVKELDVCLAFYHILSNSVKRAQEAIPGKDFGKLEVELDYQVTSIRNCENILAGGEQGRSNTPMDDVNLSLIMIAKNNLGIGNNLLHPERP